MNHLDIQEGKEFLAVTLKTRLEPKLFNKFTGKMKSWAQGHFDIDGRWKVPASSYLIVEEIDKWLVAELNPKPVVPNNKQRKQSRTTRALYQYTAQMDRDFRRKIQD